jgi:hypothetical protein
VVAAPLATTSRIALFMAVPTSSSSSPRCSRQLERDSQKC